MKTRNIREVEKEILKLTPSLAERVLALEADVKKLKDRNMGIINLVPEDFKEDGVDEGKWNSELGEVEYSKVDDSTLVEQNQKSLGKALGIMKKVKESRLENEVGVDDSEEVEFTKEELSTIYYATKEVGENFPSGSENEKYLNTIISKLNKMLKEK